MLRLLIIMVLACNGLSAQNFERKIIIEDNQYYLTTIDEETQLATLYTGKVNEPISKMEQWAVSIGRNQSEEFNPLAWDIKGGYLFGINFVDHPLADRMEAVKRIPLDKLDKAEDVNPVELLLRSAEQYTLTQNDPYADILRRSRILEKFWFDMCISDSAIYMAATNQGVLRIWSYDGNFWKAGPVNEVQFKNWFTLIPINQNIYLLDDSGSAWDLTNGKAIPVGNKLRDHQLSEGLLVINRDTGMISFVTAPMPRSGTTINEFISSESFTVFKKEKP